MRHLRIIERRVVRLEEVTLPKSGSDDRIRKAALAKVSDEDLATLRDAAVIGDSKRWTPQHWAACKRYLAFVKEMRRAT